MTMQSPILAAPQLSLCGISLAIGILVPVLFLPQPSSAYRPLSEPDVRVTDVVGAGLTRAGKRTTVATSGRLLAETCVARFPDYRNCVTRSVAVGFHLPFLLPVSTEVAAEEDAISTPSRAAGISMIPHAPVASFTGGG